MQKIAEAVAELDGDAIGRVLRWAADRYKVLGVAAKPSTAAGAADAGGNGNGNGVRQFSDLAELWSVVSPESEADKALVAGYWFQFGEGRTEFGAQEINSALKNLGDGIKNITTAFDTLKARKPAPVMQLKKSGTTKQARKT